MTDEIPALSDVMTFPDEPGSDTHRWIVLFEEDRTNYAVDVDGNLGIKVNSAQAGEVIRLAAGALADLSPQDADGDDVLRDMIDALEAEVSDDD
jgi:hypothetical protein